MSALGRLARTTAFKLAVLYLVVFSALTLFLLAYISYNTTALLERQLEVTINTEISSLADQYRRGGLRQLVNAVDVRSRRPSASLYLLADFSGRTIVGNVADLPLSVLALPDGQPVPVVYQRLDGDVSREYEALVRVFALPGGFRLLVGRDVEERVTFQSTIRESFQVALGVILVMGVLSWIFVARAVLKRVENMAETSRAIMTGDLGRRLDVTGSGDEFDNLATSLNQMLGRIEALMTGLKEVSDNIAHDLKTPLTRLRNRLETALREGDDEEAYRAALDRSIQEADQLIQVFDGLLRIARVEAGASGEEFGPLDVDEILADVTELYEPVIEDEGGSLAVGRSGPLPVRGNRMLISQALTNLLDNAIKYGRADDRLDVAASGWREDGWVRIEVRDRGPGIRREDRERAQQRFVRLEASRSQPGSGLGLSLVAAVARVHGGRLELGDGAPGLVAALLLPVDAGRVNREERHGSDTE